MVIDTNVWISGFLTTTGAPARLSRRVVRMGTPVFSAETFAELKERLWRPKFDRYITMEQRKNILADLESIALMVTVTPALAVRKLCRDPTDDKFIHAACAAESAWLITGDKDLLVLSERALSIGVRIVSPADAMLLTEFSSGT